MQLACRDVIPGAACDFVAQGDDAEDLPAGLPDVHVVQRWNGFGLLELGEVDPLLDDFALGHHAAVGQGRVVVGHR